MKPSSLRRLFAVMNGVARRGCIRSALSPEWADDVVQDVCLALLRRYRGLWQAGKDDACERLARVMIRNRIASLGRALRRAPARSGGACTNRRKTRHLGVKHVKRAESFGDNRPL